jgi:hypothetical protein
MASHSSLSYAIVFACIGLVLSVAIAVAETRNEGDLIVSTYVDPSDGDVYSQTTDTDSSSHYMSVSLRAWGETPNALKDDSWGDGYGINHTLSSPGLFAGFEGVYPAKHMQQTSHIPPVFDVHFTSLTGHNSSSCWFENGIYGSCPGTLAEDKP